MSLKPPAHHVLIPRNADLRGWHQGFTLVELLVVMAIVGVLVSLLLPAMGSARESARRTQCVNNVKQLAMAALNYESATGKLPAAGTYAPSREAVHFMWSDWRVDLRSGTNHSWLVTLLAYVEESPLADQLDRNEHITTTAPEALAVQPALYLCPSGEALGRTYIAEEGFGPQRATFAKGNYAAFTNPFHTDSFFQAGPISHYGLRLGKITDGTSSTLMLSEVRTRERQDDQRGAWALPWSGSSLLALDLHPSYYGTASEEDDPKSVDYAVSLASIGLNQMPNGTQADVLYRCVDLTDAQVKGLPCNAAFEKYISAAPRSLHPGGVNAARVDGTVIFLGEDIDELALVYMVNISDGELVQGSY